MKYHLQKGFLFMLLATFCSYSVQAQEGFLIKGKIKGLKDTTVLLAHYFGYNQQVIKDTAQVDATGSFTFEGKKNLPEGLYLVSLPKGKYLDIVIGNQRFSFETDTTNLINKMKVSGSKENEAFFKFQQEMSAKFEEVKALDMERRIQGPTSLAAAKIKQLQAAMTKLQQDWLKQNEGLLAAKLIKASQEPEIPDYKGALKTKADTTAMYQFQYNYYKNHFWDNIDLSDERMIRTPFLQKKLERYFEDLTIQQPDSISKEADLVLSKTKNRETRRYTVYKIASSYENPKVLGTDGAFVHMAEKYYIGEPENWDTSTVRKMKERVAILKPLLIGKRFPEMYLTDTLGREVSVNAIPGEYTVVFIYDPECGHCRESAPKLAKQVEKLKAKNIQIVAVSVDRTTDRWRKFIKEFKFGPIINGIDIHKNPTTGKEEYYTDFKGTFDVYATPVVYILDKEKKIIAKRLPVDQIEDFLNFHSKRGK